MLRAGLVLTAVLLVSSCSPGDGPSTEEPAEPAPSAASPESIDKPGSTEPPASGEASAEADTAPIAPAPAERTDPLRDPDSSDANRRAPDRYLARFRTTAGDFVVEVERDWAPRGADRFYTLTSIGFFDDTYVFRVVDGFVAQFGLSGDPEVSAAWSWAEIRDDPVTRSNTRGTITFATSGPDSRTTQVFINTGDNTNLDDMGFAPFGQVVEGLDVVDSLYADYGDGPPFGRGPDQGQIEDRGNAYVRAEFPELDRILEARIE